MLKEKDDDSSSTNTTGGAGAGGGWSKSQALSRAREKATYRFTQWKPLAAEAPSPVAMPDEPAKLTDEQAFERDYAYFEGRTLEQLVRVAETNETATLRMDAAKAMRAVDARLRVVEELKASGKWQDGAPNAPPRATP